MKKFVAEISILCVSALLHDVFEKTRDPSYDSTRLLKDFGENIYEIIVTLSRNSPEDRKIEYIPHYFEKIASSSKITRYVMLADRLDNVRFLRTVSQREKAYRVQRRNREICDSNSSSY